MKDKFYVTTAIAYTNAKPHIGHALEFIQGDFLARWKRGRGNNTYFLTGTDEHGSKNTKAAEAAGKETQEFVDEIAGRFKDLKDSFDLSWDDFIRTTDKERHWPGAQALWKKLEESGDIYEKEYEGLYCVGCEKFLTKRDIDDKGFCPNHKTKPEVLKEKNLFFRLSNYADQVKEAIESGELQILPETRRNEALAFIKDGLEDVSFSREKEKLPWGIPVPGNPDQIMYVWCDALSNYITAIGYGRDEKNFKKWWPADVHLIGKDILRFHTIYWPAMLLSAGLPLPKRVYIHGFVNMDGEKMSKSVGNVVDPVGLAGKYGSDTLRYYLLSDIPSNEDGSFSIERLEERYSADLANGLGNFASRVSTLAQSNGVWETDDVDKEVELKIDEKIKSAEEAVDSFKIHEAISNIWDLIRFGDGYIDEHKPWETKDEKVIGSIVELLGAIADPAEAVVPKAGAEIKRGIKEKRKIENLFPRLDA